MPLRRPWPEITDVFRGADALQQGVLTPAQLRSSNLRRLVHGVYAPRHLLHDHWLDCRGAALVVPPTARLTGRSLATARGLDLRRGGDPVEFVVPLRDWRPGPQGVVLRAASRGPLGQETWRGVACASRERLAFDLAARHPLGLAVGHLDAAARARIIDLGEFRAWLEGRHDDDVVLVRRAAALADARAESVPESQVRVVLVEADLDVVPQVEVWHRGRFVARVDLALVALRIAVEYEGRWRTLLDGQLSRDRQRLDALRAADWKVVHITAEVLREPAAVVDAVRRAVAERRADPTFRPTTA